MLWLASFPRSGNTFFRILLHELYGIDTAEFAVDAPKWWPTDYAKFPVVKTHELPDALVPGDRDIPAVYLVRDGRDTVVSMARHRSNIVVPGSRYWTNVLRVIYNRRFGGWSRHVRLWRRRASIVLRFEELINDPVACVERIRPWIDLPAPMLEKLPSFDSLKSREFRFDQRPTQFRSPHFRDQFFRRGKAGAWKDELPKPLLWLFYLRHGKTLSEMGYT